VTDIDIEQIMYRQKILTPIEIIERLSIYLSQLTNTVIIKSYEFRHELYHLLYISKIFRDRSMLLSLYSIKLYRK